MQIAQPANYQSSASLLDLKRMVSLFCELHDERPEVVAAQALVQEEWQIHVGKGPESDPGSGGLGTSKLIKGGMALGIGAAANTNRRFLGVSS
jgi:hypothetical protein